MKIIHHGAVSGVTGSCHQLLIEKDNSLLIDCGLFQGAEISESSDGESHLNIEFDISTVQALLVTHCHIDHVGRIPYLLAAGFQGPIIATEATAALLPMVIEDALKVGVTRNESIIKACLNLLQQQLVAVPYKKWHKVKLAGQTSAKVKFQPAGHILGSAYIEIDVKTAEKQSKRIVFSGDLGATYSPLLAAPKSPYKADIVVIESTYGDKEHQGRKARSQSLEKVLIKAVADNGIIIIPAFSIGRTQELLYELEQIIARSKNKKIANIEVIVDSPMAAKFTKHYRHFQNLWDDEAKKRVSQGRQPLNFDSLYTIDTHQEHLQVIDYLAKRDKAAIVIAASGMCTGGRVVNYLKRFLDEATTDILFVGYQAAGTTGRDIQHYADKEGGYVYIDGQKVAINAQVHTISGYSAHADQSNLVNFIKRIRHKPEKVILVHGDNEAKQALAKKLTPFVQDVVIGL
ncbi:MAG: metallo-beta-lactamase family protein [Psychromonas sp.]|jgi:metallo-beta-lactamase family protein|uniref:MBL fold metallo-hydrolase RNA specificity domain-containing protein n=1 Tax=Psychromonas sp. TaxID=1884585 RepID=UPI0039E31148